MSTIVFFDMETTDLDTDLCHLIQLSAVCEEEEFDVYTLPLRRISEKAEELTGFTVSYGRLFRHGECLYTDTVNRALRKFIRFLQSCSSDGSPVLLAAHNAWDFDAPILTRLLQRFSLLEDFQLAVSGILDTLVLSRICNPFMRYHRLTSLARYFLRRNYDAHNALEDARVLQELFDLWDPAEWIVEKATSPTLNF
ncbi:DNA polymerase III PolC-type-like [Plectropomus leopardus]|uniref:DNA polymerase III PolC-type-like n=1 Tax=Plectropomus leopardus TaxID=160734 RepID=UPI001C4A837E|nr:DNA polymerase III PolC-type-like [Plectropomus leopardus]